MKKSYSTQSGIVNDIKLYKVELSKVFYQVLL